MSSEEARPGADQQTAAVASTAEPTRRPLTSAAQRALAEAQERREQRERLAAERAGAKPGEVGGREGPDPVRYGDWENKGIASDF